MLVTSIAGMTGAVYSFAAGMACGATGFLAVFAAFGSEVSSLACFLPPNRLKKPPFFFAFLGDSSPNRAFTRLSSFAVSAGCGFSLITGCTLTVFLVCGADCTGLTLFSAGLFSITGEDFFSLKPPVISLFSFSYSEWMLESTTRIRISSSWKFLSSVICNSAISLLKKLTILLSSFSYVSVGMYTYLTFLQSLPR